MVTFSVATWGLIAGVGLITVLLSIHVLAGVVRNETELHDFRIDIARKRNAYLRGVYGLDEGESIIVAEPEEQIVAEPVAPPTERLAA